MGGVRNDCRRWASSGGDLGLGEQWPVRRQQGPAPLPAPVLQLTLVPLPPDAVAAEQFLQRLRDVRAQMLGDPDAFDDAIKAIRQCLPPALRNNRNLDAFRALSGYAVPANLDPAVGELVDSNPNLEVNTHLDALGRVPGGIIGSGDLDSRSLLYRSKAADKRKPTRARVRRVAPAAPRKKADKNLTWSLGQKRAASTQQSERSLQRGSRV